MADGASSGSSSLGGGLGPPREVLTFLVWAPVAKAFLLPLWQESQRTTPTRIIPHRVQMSRHEVGKGLASGCSTAVGRGWIRTQGSGFQPGLFPHPPWGIPETAKL